MSLPLPLNQSDFHQSTVLFIHLAELQQGQVSPQVARLLNPGTTLSCCVDSAGVRPSQQRYVIYAVLFHALCGGGRDKGGGKLLQALTRMEPWRSNLSDSANGASSGRSWRVGSLSGLIYREEIKSPREVGSEAVLWLIFSSIQSNSSEHNVRQSTQRATRDSRWRLMEFFRFFEFGKRERFSSLAAILVPGGSERLSPKCKRITLTSRGSLTETFVT